MTLKPIYGCRSSKKDLDTFPEEIKDDMGYALHRVQTGGAPLNFDHLPEIGSGVMEIKVDHAGVTYRAIYVAKFEEAVYVLGTFQKKSPTGKKLPRNIRDRLKSRYQDVAKHRPARPEFRE